MYNNNEQGCGCLAMSIFLLMLGLLASVLFSPFFILFAGIFLLLMVTSSARRTGSSRRGDAQEQDTTYTTYRRSTSSRSSSSPDAAKELENYRSNVTDVEVDVDVHTDRDDG